MRNLVRILVKGSPCVSVSLLRREKVSVYDVAAAKDGATLSVEKRDLKKVENILTASDRKYVVVNGYGGRKFFSTALLRLGIPLGLILAIAVCAIYSRYVYRLEVKSGGFYSEKVLELLEDSYSVFPIKKSDLDLESFNEKLLTLDGVSMATAKVVGTTLVCEILESSIPNLTIDLSEPIAVVATEDAVITRISVWSGRAAVSVGDVVKKGDVLIEPVMTVGESELPVRASGEVEGRVFRCEKFSYPTTSITTERTGEYTDVTEVSLWGLRTTSSLPDYSFETETDRYFLSSIIPIEVKRIRYYEVRKIVTKLDESFFSEEYLEGLAEKMKTRLPEGSEPVETHFRLKKLDNIYVLELYYETEEKIYESKINRKTESDD